MGALVAHAKAAHDGMGRLQLSTGQRVQVFSQDGQKEYVWELKGERGRELRLKEE